MSKFKSGDVVVKVCKTSADDGDFRHRCYKIGDVFELERVVEPHRSSPHLHRYSIKGKSYVLFEDEIEKTEIYNSPLWRALE